MKSTRPARFVFLHFEETPPCSEVNYIYEPYSFLRAPSPFFIGVSRSIIDACIRGISAKMLKKAIVNALLCLSGKEGFKCQDLLDVLKHLDIYEKYLSFTRNIFRRYKRGHSYFLAGFFYYWWSYSGEPRRRSKAIVVECMQNVYINGLLAAIAAIFDRAFKTVVFRRFETGSFSNADKQEMFRVYFAPNLVEVFQIAGESQMFLVKKNKNKVLIEYDIAESARYFLQKTYENSIVTVIYPRNVKDKIQLTYEDPEIKASRNFFRTRSTPIIAFIFNPHAYG